MYKNRIRKEKISGGGKKFFCFPKRPDRLKGSPSLLFGGYLGFLQSLKRAGFDADHLPPPNAAVKNEWSYTSSPLISLHDVDRQLFFFALPLLNGQRVDSSSSLIIHSGSTLVEC